MNKIAWIGLTALLAVVAGAAEVVKLEADLPALAGKSRAQLSHVFPGQENTLKGWNEWSQVVLGFRPDGKLESVSFTLKKAVSERKARGLLAQKMNLKMEGAARVTNKSGVRFMMPSGTVEHVVMVVGEASSDIGDLLANSDSKSGTQFSEIAVLYRAP